MSRGQLSAGAATDPLAGIIAELPQLTPKERRRLAKLVIDSLSPE